MKKIELRHFLDINSLSREIIVYLLNKAEENIDILLKPQSINSIFSGHIVVNLFFEPSTRTRYSFTIAAERLGAITLNPDMSALSTIKGESLIDTIRTFEAMGANIINVRHSDNFTAAFIASEVKSKTAIVNAGDGHNQHPTQALIDLLTMRQFLPNFPNISVAIVGDIKHSRVARSLIEALLIMEASAIRLVGPKEFLPNDYKDQIRVSTHTKLEDGLENVDAVVALRIQRERMLETDIPNLKKYFSQYGITQESMRHAKREAIVMHPGPMNRGVEIESSIADGSQSKIIAQVANGVAIRMAIMESLML